MNGIPVEAIAAAPDKTKALTEALEGKEHGQNEVPAAVTSRWWRAFKQECVNIYEDAMYDREKALRALQQTRKSSAMPKAVSAAKEMNRLADIAKLEPESLNVLADFLWLNLKAAKAEQTMREWQPYFDYAVGAMGNSKAINWNSPATRKDFESRWLLVFGSNWERSGLAISDLFQS